MTLLVSIAHAGGFSQRPPQTLFIVSAMYFRLAHRGKTERNGK
jgi:hypothetical protein